MMAVEAERGTRTTKRFVVIPRSGAFDLVDTTKGVRHLFSNKAVAEGHAWDFNRYPREAEALEWEAVHDG